MLESRLPVLMWRNVWQSEIYVLEECMIPQRKFRLTGAGIYCGRSCRVDKDEQRDVGAITADNL